MSYFGQSPSFGDFPFQVLTGDGTKTYKTSFKTAGERGVLVFINGAVQRPGIDYTAAGDVIVFSENINPGAQIFVYGMGLPKTEITNGESIANSVPLFSVQWWPSRSNIPAGYVAADGQELSRNTFTDAWQGIQARNVPVVAEATWQATPTERGKFTDGDGTTTFRVPDYNGKSAGSLGAVFLRGDGALSAGQAGLIQRDGVGPLKYQVVSGAGSASAAGVGKATNTSYSTGTPVEVETTTTGDEWITNTIAETRPLNVTGCWVIKLFGAVVNVGSADAAQLASDYANLITSYTSLANRVDNHEGQIGWGQTRQDVTANRVAGVVYTNTTDRPIEVHAVFGPASANNVTILCHINGLEVKRSHYIQTSSYGAMDITVWPGEEYKLSVANGSAALFYWKEFR